MAKIELHSDTLNKDYVLELTRKDIIDLERIGIVLDRSDEQLPLNALEKLLKMALYHNHGVVENEEVDTLFNEVDNLDEFSVALQNLYSATFRTLTDEKGNTKKANWVVK